MFPPLTSSTILLSLLVSSIFCFLWLSILEHMFFICLTSCYNIYIHHIHVCSDCWYLNNRLNFCHIFPMKQFLHLNKLWTICHFMSIQTTYVACIWRCLLWFLTRLCCQCGLFLFYACIHISINHSIICAILVSFPCITLCFWWCCLYGTKSALFAFIVVMPSSHNIATSLCCCGVNLFILVVVILRYDYKPALNMVVKKLFVVGTCKPWANS